MTIKGFRESLESRGEPDRRWFVRPPAEPSDMMTS